jgi:hypothetical protein
MALMTTPRRRTISAAEMVPRSLIDEMLEDMAVRLSGTAESKRCVGMSVAVALTDKSLPRARYEVRARGRVVLTRGGDAPSTFSFTASAGTADNVLRGISHPLPAILRGQVRFHGSLWHLRQLMHMFPALQRAYVEARAELIERVSDRYRFTF